MPSIPLKTISSLLDVAQRNPNKWVCKGRGYKAYYNPAQAEVTLNHYGTDIVRVNGWNETVWLGAGAWSKSDVDAINSVFFKYGIDKHARIQKGAIVVESFGNRFKYIGEIGEQ